MVRFSIAIFDVSRINSPDSLGMNVWASQTRGNKPHGRSRDSSTGHSSHEVANRIALPTLV